MSETRRKSFLYILLIIVVSGASIYLYVRYSNAKMFQSLNEHNKQDQSFFNLMIRYNEKLMLQMSTYLANDPNIQQAFLAGRKAVEAEGGGAGGPKAAEARQKLLNMVQDSWNILRERSDYRQLHFHLSPGSTSFLRVHKPDKFGDTMHELRHTIVACNETLKPTMGFETGRVISGIRGVEPVFAIDPATGERVHVGALESGNSFTDILNSTTSTHEGANFAVFLTMAHARECIWPEFLDKRLAQTPPLGQYLIEAKTNDTYKQFLTGEIIDELINQPGVRLIKTPERVYSVSAWPLRDYLSEQNPARPPVGYVVNWHNQTSLYQEHRSELQAVILLVISAALVLMWLGKAAFKAREKENEAKERMLEQMALREQSLGLVEQQKQSLETIFEAVPVAMLIVGEDAKVVKVNNQCEPVLGINSDLFMGRPPGEGLNCIHALTVNEGCGNVEECSDCTLRNAFKQAMETGEPTLMQDATLSVLRGERVVPAYFRVNASRIEIDHKQHVLFTLWDETEKRRATERIRFQASLLDQIDGLILATDLGGRITYINQAHCNFINVVRENILGQPLDRLGDSQWGARQQEILARTIETGEWHGEVTQTGPDGKEITFDCRTWCVRNEEGIVGMCGLASDITERKQNETQLLEAKQELESINQQLENTIHRTNQLAFEAQAANIAKSQFLANMSHEIRTPMNGVLGMTELLFDTDLNEEQLEYAGLVRSSAEALLTLINDILDFSKIEANHLELETIDFDLRLTLEETVDLLAVRAKDKNLEIICSIDPEVPTLLRGDPGRLRQVLINLGGNAVKFTEEGEVALEVELLGEDEDCACIRINVRDTGIGISEEQIDRLFKAFQQIDPSMTRKYGGTGLGLAISQRLVELMDGAITVCSDPGIGSTFSVKVRLQKQLANATQQPFDNAMLKAKRVLVVDDNATNRQYLRRLLESENIDCTEAESGMQALETLARAVEEQRPFHIAILDMQMPGMDGETLGRKIFADEHLSQTALIMMTSIGQRGDGARLHQLGFRAYLTKPVKKSHVIDCLTAVLNNEKNDHTLSDQPPALLTRYSLDEARRQQLRILLVEDNRVNQQVATGILGKRWTHIDVAEHGKQGLERLAEKDYDIVLMDMEMPVMDGLAAMRQIRSGRHENINPQIPIIAMTAHAMAGDRDRYLKGGADGYISKPFRPQELYNAIESLTGSESDENPVSLPAIDRSMERGERIVIDMKDFLARVGDDTEIVDRILEVFFEDNPLLVKNCQQALEKRELTDLRRLIHTLKGCSANIAAIRLCRRVNEFEHKLNDDPDWRELDHDWKKILIENAAVEAWYQDFRKKDANS